MLARVAAQPLRSPLVTGRPSGGRFESQAEDVFGSACATVDTRAARIARRTPYNLMQTEDGMIEAVIVSTARTPIGKGLSRRAEQHRRSDNGRACDRGGG